MPTDATSTNAKPPIRWDWIETQWQRGTLSNVQIAKLHEQEFARRIDESSIRLRASQYGWQRDLSEAVRREARAKLAGGANALPRTELRENPRETTNPMRSEFPSKHNPGRTNIDQEIADEEVRIVDIASDALVAIETAQRRKLAGSSILADRMEAHVLAALAVGADGTPTMVYEPGELKDLASVAGKAVETRLRVITAERKLYGMDAPTDVDREIAALIAKLAKLEARTEGETARRTSPEGETRGRTQ